MKYVKVMFGNKGANFEYQIDEVNVATVWNPKAENGRDFGGFNYASEECILRWLHRGDTVYDVIIPDDAENIKLEGATTIYRCNKIILTNPRKVTDEMAMEFYKKSNIPEKSYYKAMGAVALMNYKNTALAILRDKVNKDNIDLVLDEWNNFMNHGGDGARIESNETVVMIDKMLNEIKSDLLISISVDKEPYIKIINERVTNESKNLLLKQVGRYYNAIDNYKIENNHYKVGDLVKLKKGTLLHGTYKNIEGLEKIAKEGLICDLIVDGRSSKYPLTVGVWNLKKDYLLKDYIDFYSGATILFKGKDLEETKVIPYSNMKDITNIVTRNDYFIWSMEQTKEARFMPSYQQENVQIGIIFNGNNSYAKELLKGDILNNELSDLDVKPFVDEWFYERFLKDRKEKDDFFTDRESAIIFGIPSCFIEGILVGRKYEKDIKMLKKIKELLPNCYICNLDGKVIFK